MFVRLFLSYARNDDEPFVARIHAALTAAGFSVWFDRVSMPSRSLTFHQEIRDAVTACERLVLVIGPNAASSDYVTQEWRFGYFEALKCVNPIVRLDGVDAAGKKIDAYSLIPEDLRLIHAEDFRDDAQFDAHLANLTRQLCDPLPPAGKLVAVPELPPHYLDQPVRITALRDILLADLQKPVVVSGAAARVGLQGMGGIGKSVLASALAHRPEVRRAFPDGVYWVTLGQEPNVADLQRGLARALGDGGLFTGVDAGKEKLRELLGGRAALLVLDDVWRRGHAEAFNVLGPRGRLLLTTRDAGLVTALAAKENHYQVQLPTEAEAEALLAKAAGVPIPELPAEARDVVDECGRLPLGLALCGGMVHGGRTWQDVLDALREHDLEYLSDSHPAEEQHRSIWKAMDVSIRALAADERERFAELAVFALDTGAPEAAVETLWGHTSGLSSRHARDLLLNFRQRSLIDFDSNTRRMELHDLLHNFASGMAPKQFGSLEVLHRRLLDAYREKCTGGWRSGPNDGYFLENLVHHLIAAGQMDDAVALLTDLPWIEAKCKAGLAFGLQEDYRQTVAALPESQAELQEEQRRESEVARWTQTLIECAEQKRTPKPEEILKSVEPWTDEQIEAESKRIIENPARLDRLRAFAGFVEQELYPLHECVKRPGFAVQHAFNSAPKGPVHVSAAAQIEAVRTPLLLRRWPRNAAYNPKPALLCTLEGHSDTVNSVAVTADGKRAVSASKDNTLKVWDLETGCALRTLEGHSNTVNSAAVTVDGKRAVSASEDGTLKVWDVETGLALRTLKGHSYEVRAVAMTADGKRAVSASEDGTLKVWDVETGLALRTLEGHSDTVNSVAVTADGKRAVSASEDETLKVWDLETGLVLRTLEGHSNYVHAVAVTPDGKKAVSASWDETKVWDLETGLALRTSEGRYSHVVHGVAVTADGKRAVSAYGRRLRVWDLETGRALRTLEGHSFNVWGVAVTADGKRAVSASEDNTLKVWDLETGRASRALEDHADAVDSVAVTADGKRAVSASKDNTLKVWGLDTGRVLCTLEGDEDDTVHAVAVTPDGRKAVSASSVDRLKVWDLETGRALRTLDGYSPHEVNAVAIMPDGKRAVSASDDNTLMVRDLETGRPLRILEGHSSRVLDVAVTADGKRAVSASGDNTLNVWDLETGRALRTLEGHSNTVGAVAVTPDGKRAVSAANDNTLKVWDLETGLALRTLVGHSDWVLGVKVTLDGKRAVSASRDGTLKVWDLETGDCLAIVRLNAVCWAVAVARDNRIVAGTSTGEVLFYNARGLDPKRQRQASQSRGGCSVMRPILRLWKHVSHRDVDG